MNEPPENPRPAGGDPESPDPRAPDTPAPVPTAETDADATPDRPPPYHGTYGAQPGQTPPVQAPTGQPTGQPLPVYPPPPHPGYGPPGQPYPGQGGPQDVLAGRGARLGAGILDSLILAVVAAPAILFSIRWDKVRDSATSGEPMTDPLELYNVPRLAVGYLFAFLVGFVYYTVLHARWGQTVGKRAVGIRLVKASDHSAVTWRQAIGRQAFVYVVTVATTALNLFAGAAGVLGLVGLLDNAWILWDERRQALHDKVAGTVVVKAAPWMPNPYARA